MSHDLKDVSTPASKAVAMAVATVVESRQPTRRDGRRDGRHNPRDGVTTLSRRRRDAVATAIEIADVMATATADAAAATIFATPSRRLK